MATATLQSFNVFLTDRLTAAAVDIYGFVEKTIIDYQEEVYRAKMENQRLQRLLDLVYKPEIRLHRADSRQSDLPRLTQEVCAREQQIQKKCVVIEAKEEPVSLRFKEEQTEPWTASVETLVYTDVTDTQMAAVGERDSNLSPGSLTRGEYEAPQNQGGQHTEYGEPPQCDLLSQSFRASRLFKKRKMFSCMICCQAFLRKAELKSHLPSHTTKTLPHSTSKFTCLVFGRRVSNRSQMTRHMRTHTGEKPYGCSLCGNRYKLKSHIKEHARTHTGERPYACHVCGKSFNRSSTMSKHAKIQHGEDMPFKCAQCNQRFPLLVVFKRHMRAAHDITFSV